MPNLSRPAHAASGDASHDRSLRGQSFVEFALVLPLLLVMLLGVSDFGRVFAAGIIVEAAARNGAEVAAQEFVQLHRANGGTLAATDYDRLHDVAVSAACSEAEKLGAGGTCALNGVTVCVHDDVDPQCGSETTTADANCTATRAIGSDPSNQQAAVGGLAALPYVEVRTCYRFTTIFNLADLSMPFGWSIPLGEVWLERDRYFVAGEY